MFFSCSQGMFGPTTTTHTHTHTHLHTHTHARKSTNRSTNKPIIFNSLSMTSDHLWGRFPHPHTLHYTTPQIITNCTFNNLMPPPIPPDLPPHTTTPYSACDWSLVGRGAGEVATLSSGVLQLKPAPRPSLRGVHKPHIR